MSRRGGVSHLMYAAVALVLLLTPVLAVARPQPTLAAGVVSQCTETALRAALAGGGLVTFSCSGTIVLTDFIVINFDTAIDGGGSVTLDGGGANVMFFVAPDTHLELRDIALTGGFHEFQSGGLIDNQRGVVTITGSTLSDSSAAFGGAISNTGVLNIYNSTLSGNSASYGGAIDNLGVLNIYSSTLSGNSATYGGAINSDVGSTAIVASTLSGNIANHGGALFNWNGTTTITASTLSGNSATFDGAAINNFEGSTTIAASTLRDNHANSDGGAIYNEPGTTTLIASTLAGNTASSSAGAIFNNGTLAISASTLSGNNAPLGGTIRHLGGTATIAASVLSGGNLCSGAVTSTGYNVASGATCNLTNTGDLQNSDPVLGPLQDNGGLTATLLPQSGSPAIDHVPNGVCATLSAANDGRDQRGALRPTGNAPCDSGAAESDVSVSPWLIAAFALPTSMTAGHSATFYAVGSGPLGAALLYSFGCPTGTLGPQAGATADCTFPTPGVVAVPVTASTAGPPASSDSVTIDVEVLVDTYFCVGERSGALRYLVTPNGCVRGEYRLERSPFGSYLFCVGDRSGSLRYVNTPGCLRGESLLILPQQGPITICVGELSRAVRYVANAGQCNPRGELAYSITDPVP